MTTALRVKVHPELVKLNSVAFWDQDEAHYAVAPEYREKWGGAFIYGDATKPDVTYLVADTLAARQAIQLGKLVLVEEIPDFTLTPVEPPAPPVDPNTPPADPATPSVPPTVETDGQGVGKKAKG